MESYRAFRSHLLPVRTYHNLSADVRALEGFKGLHHWSKKHSLTFFPSLST